ncbi:DNA-directed RNA polymerase subunit D [Candidatus Bathyarchaeota archaeon]|nr:DNA-directed RNA polymerase subunit D [Candidatus Bathyarchaeota archaeon]
MKVEVLGVDGDRVRFLLGGVNVAFANALRRTMIMDVPCMVIDDIFFFDNSSVVADENLAHRIGYVPLRTDLDRYVLPVDCECGSELGCEKCRVVLTLDVEAKTETRTVYSGDFVSEDPAVVPVSPGIPLTKIAPGQAVRLEAYAKLGTGKEHSKWQPVSSAVYQHVAEIEMDEDRCTDCAECVKVCPRDVFTIEGGKLRVVDVNGCIICGECEKACPVDPSAVRVGALDDLFLFTVESTGCLEPARLVVEAVRVLSVKLDEFAGKLERGETEDVIDAFEVVEVERRRLYGVGAGDFDEEEAEAEEDVVSDVEQ